MDTKHNSHNIFTHYKSIAFIIIAVFVLIVRKSDSLSNPQLWAEDGTVFFAQQYEYGAASIFTAYAGYLHVVPRLIAAFTDLFFSYADVPAVYNYACLFITIIVIANCFSPRLQLPFKPLLALSIVLVPHSLNEVFLNITNIQWILCLLLILTLLKDPPNDKYGNYTLQVLSDFTVIILAGLTGPFLIFMIPFFTWKYLSMKKTHGYILLVTAFCIALIQLIQIVPDTKSVQENSIFNYELYLSVVGRQLFGGLFFGRALKYSNGILAGICALTYFGFLFYLSYKKSPEDRRLLNIVIIILSISAAVLGAVIINHNFSPLIMEISSGCRYFYVPYVMTAWSLIFCINQHGIWKNIFVMSSLLLILYSSVSVGMRTKMEDYNWKYYSGLIGTKAVVNIPINPTWCITLHGKK